MIAVENRLENGADLPGLVAHVAAEVAALLGASELELRFVVLDGGTGSQAWTEDVDGVPVSFLAAELFPGGEVGECLVAHEAAHAVHHRVRPGPWPVTVATKLFDEAVAMGVSRAVATGVRDVDAAAFGTFSEGWLDECDATWPAVRAALRVGGDERFAELFARPGLRPDEAEVPVRCGYAAALRLAPLLLASSPAAELVRLDADAATALVARALEAA